MKRWSLVALLVATRAAAEPIYESTTRSEVQAIKDSAEAVTIVPLADAAQEGTDLGTVLNRVEGVAISRQAGLGSQERFSLSGYAGDQVRLYVDGIPLELAGALSISNIPTALVDRVEIYRGVVPLRFGADALGGVVNLVTAPRESLYGGALSLEAGSFGTYRGTATLHARDPKTGLYGAATGFADYAKNDYDVDVQIPDAQGRPHEESVPRFHDAYFARGAMLDVGVLDEPWARRITLRGFYSEYDKDLQNNPVMTVPYGAVTYGERVLGLTLDVDQPHALGGKVDLDSTVSYSRRTTRFTDLSDDAYNWLGQIVAQRPSEGEIDGSPHDIRLYRDTVYARLGALWHIARHHALRLGSTASYTLIRGESRAGLLPYETDPLKEPQTVLRIVSGLEYTFDWKRLEAIASVKHYYEHAQADDVLTGASLEAVRLDSQTAGGSALLRAWLWRRTLAVKASYEYATRLPSATEIFGDGILVASNGALAPERSHNVNLGLQLDPWRTRAGTFEGEASALYRDASRLIVLLGNLRSFGYANVYGARGAGVEGALRWHSPRDYVVVDGSVSWQDLRNDAKGGAYGMYEGDRIPNLPWLLAHVAVRGQYGSLARRGDRLSLTYDLRYVHSFYRDWSSLGAPEYRPTIDAQLVHSLHLVYFLPSRVPASFAFDVENIGNARVFDLYGAQRPGRAFYGKTTLRF